MFHGQKFRTFFPVGFFLFDECIYLCNPARVAKLVDALCSGRSVRKDVLVRIQSRALINPYKSMIYRGFCILTQFFLPLLFAFSPLNFQAGSRKVPTEIPTLFVVGS